MDEPQRARVQRSAMARTAGSRGGRPYVRSASSGHPSAARCTRTWWVRPVSRRASMRAAPGNCSSTRQLVTARLPVRTRLENFVRACGSRPYSVSIRPPGPGGLPATSASYTRSTVWALNAAASAAMVASSFATTSRPEVSLSMR